MNHENVKIPCSRNTNDLLPCFGVPNTSVLVSSDNTRMILDDTCSINREDHRIRPTTRIIVDTQAGRLDISNRITDNAVRITRGYESVNVPLRCTCKRYLVVGCVVSSVANKVRNFLLTFECNRANDVLSCISLRIDLQITTENGISK